MLTEIAATVMLDYWALGEKSINGYCPLGSRIQNLTVTFGPDYVAEMSCAKNPMNPIAAPFIETMLDFYSYDEFSGLDLDDLRRSPKLTKWLHDELVYVEKQRALSRKFLVYLAGLDYDYEQLSSVMKIDQSWQRDLCHDFQDMLWDFYKNEIDPIEAFDDMAWGAYTASRPDASCINLTHFGVESYGRFEPSRELAFQMVSAFAFDSIGEDDKGTLRKNLRQPEPDCGLIYDVLNHYQPISSASHGPQLALYAE